MTAIYRVEVYNNSADGRANERSIGRDARSWCCC